MNEKFIINQIKEIESGLKDKSLDIEDRRIWTILEYLKSILKSEDYSEQKREDLRRLALEISFDEKKGFSDWIKENNQPKS